MDAKEKARQIRERIEALRANRAEETGKIILDLIAQIKLRVQVDSEDYLGSPFPGYVPGYARQRAKAGYQIDHFDFTRTGEAWRSVLPQAVAETLDSITILAAPTRQDNIDKFRGAVRKRGNLVRPSDEEIQIAANSNRERIRKYLDI